ncbi:MAG: hypothetical protein WBL65_22260 [Bryobacteraceae bacterium]
MPLISGARRFHSHGIAQKVRFVLLDSRALDYHVGVPALIPGGPPCIEP